MSLPLPPAPMSPQPRDKRWENSPMQGTELKLFCRIEVDIVLLLHANLIVPCAKLPTRPDLWDATLLCMPARRALLDEWENNVSSPFTHGFWRNQDTALAAARQILQDSWRKSDWLFKHSKTALYRLNPKDSYSHVIPAYNEHLIAHSSSRQNITADELREWLTEHMRDSLHSTGYKRPLEDNGDQSFTPYMPPRKRKRRTGRFWPSWVRRMPVREGVDAWGSAPVLIQSERMDVDSSLDIEHLHMNFESLKGVTYPSPTFHGVSVIDDGGLRVSMRCQSENDARDFYPSASIRQDNFEVGFANDHFRAIIMLLIMYENEIDTLMPSHRRPQAKNGIMPLAFRYGDAPLSHLFQMILRQRKTAGYEDEGDGGQMIEEVYNVKELRMFLGNTAFYRSRLRQPDSKEEEEEEEEEKRVRRERNEPQIVVRSRENMILRAPGRPGYLLFQQHEATTNAQHIHLWKQFLAALIRLAALIAAPVPPQSEDTDWWLGSEYGNRWMEWHDGQSIYDLFDLLGLEHGNPIRQHFEQRAAYFATPPLPETAETGEIIDINGDSLDIEGPDVREIMPNDDLPEVLDKDDSHFISAESTQAQRPCTHVQALSDVRGSEAAQDPRDVRLESFEQRPRDETYDPTLFGTPDGDSDKPTKFDRMYQEARRVLTHDERYNAYRRPVITPPTASSSGEKPEERSDKRLVEDQERSEFGDYEAGVEEFGPRDPSLENYEAEVSPSQSQRSSAPSPPDSPSRKPQLDVIVEEEPEEKPRGHGADQGASQDDKWQETVRYYREPPALHGLSESSSGASQPSRSNNEKQDVLKEARSSLSQTAIREEGILDEPIEDDIDELFQ